MSKKMTENKKQDVSDKKETSKQKKEVCYFVSQGKSLTTKRGIVANGEPIYPDDLAGGEAVLVSFCESGHVFKR